MSFHSNASNLKFEGLNKFSLSDINNITSIDLTKTKLNEEEINTIIKELFISDLIQNVSFSKKNNFYTIYLSENKIIKDIFINGNVRIKNEFILSSIRSKTNRLLNNNDILDDIETIRNLYKSIGFDQTSIVTSSEYFSADKINLIFDIHEGPQSKLAYIKFDGNKSFTNKFLESLISSKSNNFYNIFTSGSNLNESLFLSDVNKISSFYRDKGFFDVKVVYKINKTSFSKYNLIFHINEGNRYEINSIKYSYNDQDIKFKKLEANFLKLINKNNNFFDYSLIQEQLNKLNKNLKNNGFKNSVFSYDFESHGSENILTFNQIKQNPHYINSINIYGNSVTKDKTIRSKLLFGPGDFYDQNLIRQSKKNLKSLKYINGVSIDSLFINNEKYDISININENKKTGNFLFGGSFSGDTGLGFAISIKDYNLLGLGNEIDSSFAINEETALFKIDYSSDSKAFPLLKNTYSIFNEEDDLTDSFGYKVKKNGIGYRLNFSFSETLSISSGISYEDSIGHSGSSNKSFISDNIGDFQNISFNFILKSNKTNNFLYPTNGSSNRLSVKFSPDELSDEAYFQALLNNEIYFQMKNSKSFFFTDNNIGIAESTNGKLKTKNAFSLGGLNFKGFDYRGIGQFEDNLYLGGNKYFTSSIGYGSSFLFDNKDNINIKLFMTVGSLWDSDYISNNNLKLRSSAGFSFDILTAVGPLSLSYAIPLKKYSSDKIKEFNFSLGTSF